MHRLSADQMKQHFTKEQLQTYIKVCKTQKPMFTAESAEILKVEYKKMRQNDNTKGKTAYRTTVRQLESLVRLSEAMARLHCDTKIRPSYVSEVCRLLRSSNIDVIKNDLEFEENQEAIN
jgi:DNA replication licensing factor MCM6